MENKKIDRADNKKKAKFDKKESKFLLKMEVCRIATCHNDIPHVVPVAYIYENGFFYIATDYNTRKYKNVCVNNNVSLVVDVYDLSGENKAVLIQGTAEIIDRGGEFIMLYQKFHRKFEWVREDPWKEGEAPFIKIKALNKISWGL
jgi:nitroimidazol reductase NimA-like FMN-containing flavoprotein (pyridoxamine 5'-phosphate oxidase superfamily)